MDDGPVRDSAVRADSEQLPRLHLPRHVTSDDAGGVKVVSHGHMTDFVYDSTMDHIMVNYKEVGYSQTIENM